MNTFRCRRAVILSLVLAAVAVFGFAAPASARADKFAAIAYSPSTGAYGYAYGKACRDEAERTALGYCKGADARILVSCEDSCAALAVGDNGVYGYATADTRREAERLAIQKCLDAGGCNPRIRCWANSGK
ncbi:MAG TPA: DUF4189 domain-containing protein [Gemmataceae bacterium]|nr:DUF4189 domain-containing protein [Gemmataceae bacterium]